MEYAEAGGTTWKYAYLESGELHSKSAGSVTTTYDYDVFGNLRRADLGDGRVVEYLVDAMQRRVGKKINGTLVQGFLYQDQLNPIAELDGAGQVVSRFVYGSRANVPDYLVRGGVTYRIVADHLGSPRLAIDTATGAVAQEMRFDEFGRVTLDTHPGFQPFGFAGGIYDMDVGLVRFGARDYDPVVGRWTNKDPLLFLGGSTNLYAYVDSDPMNYVDRSGLTKGGKKRVNINHWLTEGRSVTEGREKLQPIIDRIEEYLRAGKAASKAEAASLRQWVKLAKRGGTMSLVGVAFELIFVDELNADETCFEIPDIPEAELEKLREEAEALHFGPAPPVEWPTVE